MTEVIPEFQGKYRWLSNFYLCRVEFEGDTYASAEHAYQAAKLKDRARRSVVMANRTTTLSQSPQHVKQWGKRVPIREDWEDVKLQVMKDILTSKFLDNTLRAQLLSTGSVELVEGNWWHDNFWGSCRCRKCGDHGLNHLGKLLMQIRSSYYVS